MSDLTIEAAAEALDALGAWPPIVGRHPITGRPVLAPSGGVPGADQWPRCTGCGAPAAAAVAWARA